MVLVLLAVLAMEVMLHQLTEVLVAVEVVVATEMVVTEVEE